MRRLSAFSAAALAWAALSLQPAAAQGLNLGSFGAGSPLSRATPLLNFGSASPLPAVDLNFASNSAKLGLTDVPSAALGALLNYTGPAVTSTVQGADRTNYELYSEDASQWSAASAGSTVTTDTGPSPTGTTTADTVALTSGGYLYDGASGVLQPGTYVASLYAQTTSGTGSTGFRITTPTGAQSISTACSLTTTFTRCTVSITLTAASSLFVGIDQRSAANGPAAAINMRVWGMMLEKAQPSWLATGPTDYIATTSAAAAAPGMIYTLAPRTNYLPNSTMQGAAVGTYPSNWPSPGVPFGLTTVAVVGIGTETGLPYIDWSVQGTPTSSGTVALYETNYGSGGVTASNGQAWTASTLMRLVSGALPSNALLQIVMLNGSTYLAAGPSSVFGSSVGATPLRVVASGTLSNSSVTGISPYIGIPVVSGTPVSVVLRIYGPMLEQASTVATYFVPTTSAAVTSTGPRISDKGFFVEEARSNTVQYSTAPGNGAWTLNAVTVTTGAASPDGANTGRKVVEDTTTALHRLTGSLFSTPTASSTYTLSIYAKAAERSVLYLNGAAAIGANATFNLTTCAVQNTANGSATATLQTNGYCRLAVTGTAPASPAAQFFISVDPSGLNGDQSYAGDGASGLYVWGVQLEAGSFATSYAPTTSAAISRAADLSQAPGCFAGAAGGAAAVLAYGTSAAGGSPRLLGSTSGNGSSALLYATGGTILGTYNGSAVLTASYTSSPTTQFRSAVSWATSGRSLSANGGTPNGDTGAIGSFSGVTLGNDGGSVNFYDGVISRVECFATPLSSAQLQAAPF